MVVSLVRPKSCPSGGGSAFLENGYGIERDLALAFRAFQANQHLLHRARPQVYRVTILSERSWLGTRKRRLAHEVLRDEPAKALDGLGDAI
jgi:hypothetical protein